MDSQKENNEAVTTTASPIANSYLYSSKVLVAPLQLGDSFIPSPHTTLVAKAVHIYGSLVDTSQQPMTFPCNLALPPGYLENMEVTCGFSFPNHGAKKFGWRVLFETQIFSSNSKYSSVL